MDFLTILKIIQSEGKILVLFPEAWEVENLLSELLTRGLYMNIKNVKNESEAKELLKKIEKY